MKNVWFRLYNEIINDPKVIIMPEEMRWRYVAVLCLHSNGQLVGCPDDEIALALRVTVESWQKTKKILQSRGLIEKDNKPHGWDNRQYISDLKDPTAAERQRRYRKNRNATVTSRLPEQNRTEQIITDTDTDSILPRKAQPKKGTRLSNDWLMDERLKQIALEVAGKVGVTPDDSDLDLQADAFRDYWLGRSGQGAAKLDWDATWRTWIRRWADGEFKRLTRQQQIDQQWQQRLAK